jgi:quercetin dioxygenase-like cupin family protein
LATPPTPEELTTMSAHGIRFSRWDDVPRETVTDDIGRRLFTGERMMLAQVYLDRGAVVPWHSHENEQLTWVVTGALRFLIGNEGTDDVEDVLVSAGDVLYIPSNVPHRAEALEDTLDVDIFSPPRQDWLTGTDTYFQER